MLRRACLDLLKTRPLHPCASVLTPGIFGGGNRTLSSASASSSSSGKDDDEKEKAEGWGDLPKSEEELANRRAKALRKWLENEVGEERASLMTILGTHKVKVPGGGEEAKAFMDDLLLWKAKAQLLKEEEETGRATGEKKKKRFEEEFGLPFDE
jgi:hypothetical protein